VKLESPEKPGMGEERTKTPLDGQICSITLVGCWGVRIVLKFRQLVEESSWKPTVIQKELEREVKVMIDGGMSLKERKE
jgi:hypothetical protein